MDTPIEVNRTEQAKLDFVAGLMAYNSTGIGPAMVEHYNSNQDKLPAHPQMPDVKAVMEPASPYKFGAFFERHNHAMMFQTILDIVHRQKETADEWLDNFNAPGALGSLTLDLDLAVPRYYKNVEIHTQPGSYHGEYGGVLYHWMIDPFLCHRDCGDEMGFALARGIPKGDHRKILDLGCGVGKSTFPYCQLYPNAEIHGLDYAAPMLKYGHKLAEARGAKVHFKQALAEATGYEDNSFDVVSAVWLFHEIPRKAMNEIIREAHRILKPGGYFAIMESPPFKALNEDYSPLTEFLLDSTGRRMSDPFIPMFFSLDRAELFQENGFEEAWEEALPNELTGWSSDEQYFFGAFPWWMTIGRKQ